MERTPFTGVVLTGGSSRRMGADKALVAVGGVPLAASVATALADAGAVRVLAVGGSAPSLAVHGLVPVADRWPGAGPLGGMITGLDRAAADDGVPPVAVVAACDLPRLTATVVAALVEALVAADAETTLGAAPVVGGIVQTHLVALRLSARRALAEAFAAGERAPRRALAGGLVPVELGPAAVAVVDVDTPDDLASLGTISSPHAPPRAPAP